MSGVSSSGIFEVSGVSHPEVSACHIEPYLVISPSTSPLGFVGMANNQRRLIIKGGI